METTRKTLEALASIASPYAARFALNSVAIEPDHMVASDGSALIAQPIPRADVPGGRVLIPRDTILKQYKSIARPAELVDLDTANANGDLSAKGPRGSLTTKTGDGVFPDWPKVLPGADGFVARAWFDPAMLAAVAAALAKLDESDAPAIAVDFYGDGRAAMLWAPRADGAFAALMPVVTPERPEPPRGMPAPPVDDRGMPAPPADDRND